MKIAFVVPLLLGLTGVDWNIPMREWWYICAMSIFLRFQAQQLKTKSSDEQSSMELSQQAKA